MYIAIEGLDGVGKTTTAIKLAERLNAFYCSKAFHFMKYPSGRYDNFTALSECTGLESDYGMRSAFLYARFMNRDVVTERYFFTNYAANPTPETLEATTQSVEYFGAPDLTFILYCDYETNYRRMYDRDPNDKDLDKLKLHKQFYENLSASVKYFGMNYIFVDTTSLTLEQTVDQLYRLVREQAACNFGVVNNFIARLLSDDGREVFIPDGVDKIPCDAFDHCAELKIIRVSDGNKKFASKDGVLCDKSGRRIFRMPRNYERTHYALPEGIEQIHFNAFRDCNVESVELNAECDRIGYIAFLNCRRLRALRLSAKLSSIGKNAFTGCRHIRRVDVNGSRYSFADGLLFDENGDLICDLGSEHETIFFDGEKIFAWSFAQNKNLKSITLGGTVKVIGSYAFTDSSIETVAFHSATEIHDYVFWNCERLRSITFFDETPPRLARQLFCGIDHKIKIYVPERAAENYRLAFQNYRDKVEVMIVDGGRGDGGATKIFERRDKS